ncbi:MULTISPECIES: choline sulfate utilization transcriptional regulator [unclassified Pseudomonas]|uniref:choline sulfate utilization transcriptional regulator n=1 Tax=unclassified Pseudomonas TaxID=196821 RepID=UPI002360383D|nr:MULTISPECIES: LysR substrate-binding domain-containing protein [unclassified Pseudomonas]
MSDRHGKAFLDATLPADRPALALDSLRTFEVVARRLSFTAAASELGTTQPAISQQIKRLEAQLQVRLFDRVHRGILLTEAGQLLQEYVEAGLATLDEGVRLVTARPAHEVLQVATDFAFAAYWLLPRLPRFHARHPELDVSLVTSDRVPLPGPEIDITLGFGDGRFKHGEAWPLFREEVFPVCSPRLLQGRQPPLPAMELGRWPLLHLKAAPNSRWYDWKTLLPALDLAPLPAAPSGAVLSFDNYTLVIQAAIAGQGLAIGWRHLVDDLLRQELLCRPFAGLATSRYGYYAILPERKRRQRLVQRFLDWLLEELELPRESLAGARLAT